MSATKCAQCNSSRIWKDGIRYTPDGKVQRYVCRDCGYRFSERKPLQKTPSCRINRPVALGYSRQVCDCLTEASKNLTEVDARQEMAQREGTASDQAFIKGKIVQFMVWQEKEGYRPSTAEGRTEIISNLARKLGPQLFNPEAVKEYLANLKRCDGYKSNIVDAYTAFLQMQNETWKPPRYKTQSKMPFVPLEAELDQLISAAGKSTGTTSTGTKRNRSRPRRTHRSRMDRPKHTSKDNHH